MKGYIYKFQENNLVYIGSTINFKKRISSHKIKKHFSESVSISVIFEYDFQNIDDMFIIEKIFIRDYRITHKCLNKLPLNDIKNHSIPKRFKKILTNLSPHTNTFSHIYRGGGIYAKSL